MIAMNNEINLSAGHRRGQIITLSQLSEFSNQKPFPEMTRDNILAYLNSCRKSEDIDPLHKWIGTFDLRRNYLLKFFNGFTIQILNQTKDLFRK
jgi:hypothetical protein